MLGCVSTGPRLSAGWTTRSGAHVSQYASPERCPAPAVCHAIRKGHGGTGWLPDPTGQGHYSPYMNPVLPQGVESEGTPLVPLVPARDELLSVYLSV